MRMAAAEAFNACMREDTFDAAVAEARAALLCAVFLPFVAGPTGAEVAREVMLAASFQLTPDAAGVLASPEGLARLVRAQAAVRGWLTRLALWEEGP